MLIHEELTSKILSCFFKVYNKLGYGFLEKVYENALMIELQKQEIRCKQQAAIKVYYNENEVGSYFTDILVEDLIILELKAGEGSILREHELQLTNYLKATNYEVGLILHFGEKPSFKRKVFTNDLK